MSDTEARHALLRVLHPGGYRDLRALREGQAETASCAADDPTRVDQFADAHHDWNVFVGVATRKANGRGLDDCLELHALFADLDFKDFPSGGEAEARARLAQFPYAPSAVVASGGGLQAYWFLETPLDLRNGNAPNVGKVLCALTVQLGADPKAAEPARILRLPGTLNHKYDPPRLVVVESCDATRRYPVPSFLANVPEPTTAPAPLPNVITSGSRNNVLFREGSRLRRLGWSAQEIEKALAIVNQRCDPPLSASELHSIVSDLGKYEPAKDLFPTTEAGDAEFFAEANADTVRFNHRTKAWLHFREHFWEEQSDGEIHRLALEAVRARQRAAVGDKERLRWAAGGESRRRQDNLLSLAANFKPLADRGDEWDVRTDLLGVRNGVIDLRTGVLRPGQPEDRITLVSPLVFEPAAPTAKWKQFVLEICDGNAELADYFQVVFGYILTGETGEQCFWIFWGDGANGKSTLLDIITKYVIPHHSWTMTFPSAQWTEAMTSYQKAQLANRRLLVSLENEKSQRLNTEMVKSLTGSDEVEARHPYGRPFNFTPILKFVLAVNHKPSITDESHGMWRRVRLVPFLRTFEQNPAFAESLAAEAPGALAWAVEGAVRYYRDGMTTPELVKVATADYRRESDALAPFFEENCVFDEKLYAKAQAVYDELKRWYERRDTPKCERMSQKQFGQWIAKDPRVTVRRGPRPLLHDTTVYYGVALLERREEARGEEDSRGM